MAHGNGAKLRVDEASAPFADGDTEARGARTAEVQREQQCRAGVLPASCALPPLLSPGAHGPAIWAWNWVVDAAAAAFPGICHLSPRLWENQALASFSRTSCPGAGGSLPQLPLQPEPSQVNNQLPSPQSGREQ